ncbi:MAG: hypothetical protein QM777_20325 [Pseudorhodoferax sp.]
MATVTTPPNAWEPDLDLVRENPALLQLIRCALPASLTRKDAGGPASDPATPSHVWRDAGRRDNRYGYYLLLWPKGGPQPRWGLVHVSKEEGLNLLRVDGGQKWAAWLASVTPVLAPLCADCAGRAVEWIGVCADDGQTDGLRPAAGTAQQADEPDETPLAERIRQWHEALEKTEEAAALQLHRTSEVPMAGSLADWQRNWKPASASMRARLCLAIRKEIKNYRLLDDDTLQRVRLTTLPSYQHVYLVEIVDRRDLRTRRTEFLFDYKAPDGTFSVLPLTGESSALHDIGARGHQRGEDHWSQQFSSAEQAARYLAFFTRSLYSGSSQTFFELILDPARDLRPYTHLAQDHAVLKDLLREPQAIGLWPMDTAAQADGADGADGVDGAQAVGPFLDTQAHHFSSLMLFGRNLYLVALKVCLRRGLPHVEMLTDVLCAGAENLPVRPMTLDPDGEFVLSAGTEPAGDTPAPDGDDAGAEPPLRHGQTTASGSIDGSAFCALMEDAHHRRLPRGEDTDPRVVERDRAEVLTVADAVSMRGRRGLRGSRIAIGVHFRGRVDLREIAIEGTLTFAHCTFDEPLLLDGAQIAGSLVLKGSALLGGASLRGARVRGTLDLSSAVYAHDDDPRKSVGLSLEAATIEGDVDLRGMGQYAAGLQGDGLRLDGSRVHGSLRLGCGAGGHREPMLLPGITGRGLRVKGSLHLWGACSVERLPLTELDFTGAHVGGDIEIRPHEPRVQALPFDRDRFDAPELDGQHSPPRIARLDLSQARIAGSVLGCGFQVAGILDLDYAHIAGQVDLQSCFTRQRPGQESRGTPPVLEWRVQLQSLRLRAVRVAGMVCLQGVEIRGDSGHQPDLYLAEAEVQGLIHVGPADILGLDAQALSHIVRNRPSVLRTCVHGKVDLSGLRCSSHIRFRGVYIREYLILLNTRTGSLCLDPALIECHEDGKDQGWELVPPQVGGVFVVGSTIEGWLRMAVLQVHGWPLPREMRGVYIHNTTVEDNVHLWRVGFDRDAAFHDLGSEARPVAAHLHDNLQTWRYATAVHGDLVLRHCTLHGDCILSLSKADGRIDIGESWVHGALMLASLLSHREADEGNKDRMKALAAAHDDRDWLQRTWCRHLSLAALKCEGDVQLDGVHIVSAQEDEDALDARHLRVRGELGWADDAHSALKVERGRLRLEDTELNRFKLSSRCLPAPLAEPVKLYRAKIRTLQLQWYPGGPADKWQDTGRLDLRGAEVAEWELRCGASVNQAGDFARLIGRKAPRPVWIALEHYLRRGGHDREADDLYVSMRRHVGTEGASTEQILFQLGTGLAFALAALLVLWLSSWLSVWMSGAGLAAAVGLLAAAVVAAAFWPQSLPWVMDRIHDRATRFGTTARPILWAWGSLLILSMPVYLAQDNFELSNTARGARKVQATAQDAAASGQGAPYMDLVERAGSWSLGHAFGIGLRYHVPVIGLRTVEDWDPRTDPQAGRFELHACFGFAADKLPALHCTRQWSIPGISAHAYAMYVQAVNWVLWPLLLTFIALNLWRRRPGAEPPQ